MLYQLPVPLAGLSREQYRLSFKITALLFVFVFLNFSSRISLLKNLKRLFSLRFSVPFGTCVKPTNYRNNTEDN